MDTRSAGPRGRAPLLLTLLGITTACAGAGRTGAGPALPAVTAPASFTYAPYAARYRGVTRGHVEQEVNGRWTATDFYLRYELSVQVDSVEGELLATFVIDSVPEVAGGGFAQAQTSQAEGATFAAALAPDGALLQFRATEPMSVGPVTDVLTRLLHDFFPRLPAGGALPGAEWHDTLEASTTLGGIDIDRVERRRHLATRWTHDAENRTLLVTTRGEYELHGSGEQSGREFTLVGQGRRHVEQRLAEGGRYLGSIAADTSEATVELDVGLIIPIRQTRVDSVTIAT